MRLFPARIGPSQFSPPRTDLLPIALLPVVRHPLPSLKMPPFCAPTVRFDPSCERTDRGRIAQALMLIARERQGARESRVHGLQVAGLPAQRRSLDRVPPRRFILRTLYSALSRRCMDRL